MNDIRHAVEVGCPVAHAFAVFTERIDGWWPASHRALPESKVVLEAGVNGRLVEIAGDRQRVLGTVIAWEAPAAVTMAWNLGAPPGAPTRVTVRFASLGEERAVVEVLHTDGPVGLPDWAKTAPIFVAAWTHVLTSFSLLIAARRTGDNP